MSQEQIFATMLSYVKEMALKNQNCIQKQEVLNTFADMKLDTAQMDLVYDYLKQNKIHVLSEGDEIPEEEELELDKQDTAYLNIYLEELKLLPTYCEEEQEQIKKQAIAGDSSVKEKLIHIYLQKVVDVAKLYIGQGLSLEDLIGEGNIGLMTGMEMMFCVEYPLELDGFFMKMMMDAMEAAIKGQQDAEDFDKSMLEKVSFIHEKAQELMEEMGHKLTPKELAAEISMSEEEVNEAVQYAKEALSALDIN